MAKANVYSQTLKVEGILNLEDNFIEIEDVGEKSLTELLQRFDGQNIKISVTLVKPIV